jgi:hypothetical protein
MALHDEIGLTAAKRGAGWILSCVHSATPDVLIEFDDLGAAPMCPARTWPCRVETLERLPSDVLEVTLRMPRGRLQRPVEADLYLRKRCSGAGHSTIGPVKTTEDLQ